MPRLNRWFVPMVVLLFALSVLAQQQQTPPNTSIGSQEPMSQPPVARPPSPQQPAQPEPTPSRPPNQSSDTGQVPQAQQGQAPDQNEGGIFVFKKQVEEVMLHATVVDDKQHMVTNLDKNAFTVFEDGKPQQITRFSQADVPVSIGIIIDNSGSMRDKRPAVAQAAINLVKASNPSDEVFIVNFNEEPFLDQDFTNSVPLMQDALERIASRGGTALFDALVAASDHLTKSAKLDKKALLVVTDGEDNASRESLEAAVRKLAVDGGPTVYTIGILGDEERGAAKRAKRALRLISEQTGGVSFFPESLSEVDAISKQVAHDIRNQYTIMYKPTNPQSHGGFRTVRVEARSPGHKHLQVRTRTGYYANEQQAKTTASR